MKKIYFLTILVLALNNTITAQPMYDSIQVYPGWNLIGSRSTGPIDSLISTNPPGIIASPFYKFTPIGGYTATDSLFKLGGYWVKISDVGPIPAWLIMKTSPLWPWPHCGAVSYAGKVYTTVVIGTQCWLRENLDVGTFIDDAEFFDQLNNGVIEKWCYDNEPSNCNTYGGLYQWNEAMQYSTTPGSQGICPNGWHIPTYGELWTLKTNVSDDGNALKKSGEGWGSGLGTNTTGFTALLAGRLDYNVISREFKSIGGSTYFWSSSQSTPGSTMYNMNLYSSGSGILFFENNDENGHSVRCLKN